MALAGYVALSAVVGFARYELEPRHEYGDTFWYARTALRMTGEPEPDATVQAAQFMARERGISDYGGWVMAVREHDPRYIAIFDSRPLYPAVAAPLVAVAGLRTGLLIAALLAGVVFGSTLGWFVHAVTGSHLAAAGGIALGLALPSGQWFAVMLSDGWMLALWTLGLVAATRYAATGRWAWLATTAATMVALYATKSANGAVLVGSLVLFAAGEFLFSPRHRRRMMVLGGAVALLGVGQLVVFRVLNLPGLTDTLQDLFTAHYTQPDVDNLLGRLLDRDLSVLGSLAGDALHDPFLPVLAILLLVPLALARRAWAGLWLLAAVASSLTVLVHPVTSEVPRLLAPVWVSAAAGGALALGWLAARATPGPSADEGQLHDPHVEHAGD